MVLLGENGIQVSYSATCNEHLGSTLPTGMAHGMNFNALFGDYTVPGTTISLGYILSAITAVLVFLVLGKILMAVGKSNEHAN